MNRRWLCTVCGYIHDGEEPPDVCPVCGADRSAFTPFEGEEAAGAAASAPAARGAAAGEAPGPQPKPPKVGFFQDLIDTLVVHGVAAHFPNGVLPTAFLFLVLTLLFDIVAMESAVFYLLIVVLAATPVSFVTGWSTGKRSSRGPRRPSSTRRSRAPRGSSFSGARPWACAGFAPT